MRRFSRRRRRLVQNGVNAIFSGKAPSYHPEQIVWSSPIKNSSSVASGKRTGSRVKLARMLLALFWIGIAFTLLGSGFVSDHGSQRVSGPSGPGPRLPVRVATRMTPSFYSVSNVPEMVVRSSGVFNGTIPTMAGDFLVVQVAYSEGGSGNLPDLSNVKDTQSNTYSKIASSSPGVGENFWEQVWTGRAVSSSTSTNVSAVPDWASCLAPCVSSIIITMTIARYRDVGGVGASTAIAPSASSTSQGASIGVQESRSLLVEVLSHGASNNCETDGAQPGSGQALRNCFTGSTERTEFFDHSVESAQVYMESYSWSQLEVQRGIYLELDGSLPP